MPNTRRPAAVVVAICAPWPAITRRRPTPRAERYQTTSTSVVPECSLAAVEPRAVVAEAGGEVVVEVDLVHAGRPQGVALQVQRLGAVGLRDAGVSQSACIANERLGHEGAGGFQSRAGCGRGRDLARPQGPGGHGGGHAEDVRQFLSISSTFTLPPTRGRRGFGTPAR